MILEIPVNSEFSSYEFQTTLELTVYSFRFKWNARMERWSMSIYNDVGEPLVEGIPVFAGPLVMEQYVYDGLPPGIIVFVDSTGENIDPGRNDLGDRVRMFYITSDELLEEAA